MYPTHHPCPIWLHDKLCYSRSAVHVWRPDGPSDLVPPRMIEAGDQLDLTHLATRAAVLQACADHVASPSWMGGRAWAFGAPWSALDQEQAARACSAILTALAEEKQGPTGVLGPWTECGAFWARPRIAGFGPDTRDSEYTRVSRSLSTEDVISAQKELDALFERDLLIGIHL